MFITLEKISWKNYYENWLNKLMNIKTLRNYWMIYQNQKSKAANDVFFRLFYSNLNTFLLFNKRFI